MTRVIKVVASANGVKSELEVQPGPNNFTCLVHQQGLRVDVPEFVEINPKSTIACMENMTQKQWEYISTGPLFKTLFNIVFDKQQSNNFNHCVIPAEINELNQGDMGIAHISGMIVLGCEAFMVGKSVFIRNPETYLHPATQQRVVTMFHKMIELFGVSAQVQTAVDAPENTKEPKIKQKQLSDKELLEKFAEENPVQLVAKWLSCMDQNKNFAQVENKIYTVAEMTQEVICETDIGKQLIQQFLTSNFNIKKK